jgi:hypothetical protein
MTTLTAPAAARAAGRPLAARELRRFVANPVFLVGVGLTVYGVGASHRTVTTDANSFVWFPAIFLGGLGMIAACWLTQSMRRSAAVVDVSPTTLPVRTAAICVSAVVPFLLGIVALIVTVRFPPGGPWSWGSFGPSDRTAALIAQTLLPALGGPLLGVALGRWFRFPGTAFLVLLILYGWVSLGYILAAAHPDALLCKMVRLFSPFAFFTTTDADPGHLVTWSGPPWYFAGWQLCLCATAVLVALLRGADGAVRRRVTGGLMAALATAATMYALAVAL